MGVVWEWKLRRCRAWKAGKCTRPCCCCWCSACRFSASYDPRATCSNIQYQRNSSDLQEMAQSLPLAIYRNGSVCKRSFDTFSRGKCDEGKIRRRADPDVRHLNVKFHKACIQYKLIIKTLTLPYFSNSSPRSFSQLSSGRLLT